MGKKYDFDYIVIGSGPAGSAAATNLAKAKRHVAIVEGRFFGGSNINTHNIPYSVALDFSHTYRKFLSLPEFKNQDFKTVKCCNFNGRMVELMSDRRLASSWHFSAGNWI